MRDGKRTRTMEDDDHEEDLEVFVDGEGETDENTVFRSDIVIWSIDL